MGRRRARQGVVREQPAMPPAKRDLLGVGVGGLKQSSRVGSGASAQVTEAAEPTEAAGQAPGPPRPAPPLQLTSASEKPLYSSSRPKCSAAGALTFSGWHSPGWGRP